MRPIRACLVVVLCSLPGALWLCTAAAQPTASAAPATQKTSGNPPPPGATRPTTATAPSAELAPILKTLSDPASTGEARADAIIQLGKLGPRGAAAVPYLLDLLPNPATHDAAVHALRAVGPAAVPPLLDALLGDDATDGWMAALALHETRPLDKAAALALAKGLRSTDARIRETAAIILEDDGPAAHETIGELTAMLADHQVATRRLAVDLLGGLLSRYSVCYLAQPGQDSDTLQVNYYQTEGEPAPRVIQEAGINYVAQRQARGDRILAAARTALAAQNTTTDERISKLLEQKTTLEVTPGLATNDPETLRTRAAVLRDQIERNNQKIQKLQADRDRIAASLRHSATQPATQKAGDPPEAEDAVRTQLDGIDRDLASLKKDQTEAASALERYEASIAHFADLRSRYVQLSNELATLRRQRDRWLGAIRALPDPLSAKGLDTSRLPQTLVDRRPVWPTVTQVVPVDGKAIAALVKALADSDPQVRTAAAHALGRVGPEATPALTALDDATHDPDADVRAAATDAIKTIKPS